MFGVCFLQILVNLLHAKQTAATIALFSIDAIYVTN